MNGENNTESTELDSTQKLNDAIESTGEFKAKINPISISIPAAENGNTPIGITASTQDQDDNWQARARIFAPAIKQCALLVDSTTVKVLRGQIRACGVEKHRAEEIADLARMDDEVIETFKTSGSRILARRCKNEEVADWIAVGGAAAAWVSGISEVALEIRALRQEIRSGNRLHVVS